jgi:hypothetical protein
MLTRVQVGTLVPSTSVSSEGNPEPLPNSTQELMITLNRDSAQVMLLQDVATGNPSPTIGTATSQGEGSIPKTTTTIQVGVLCVVRKTD